MSQYGIELNNAHGQTFLSHSDVTYSFYGKYRLNKSSFSSYIWRIPVKADIPVVVFFRNLGNSTATNAKTVITQQYIFEDTYVFETLVKKGHYCWLSGDFRDEVDAYVFVPTDKLPRSKWGFEIYGDDGKMIFTASRPPMLIKTLYYVDCRLGGSLGQIIASPASKNVNYNPAVMIEYIGTDRRGSGNQQFSWHSMVNQRTLYIHREQFTNTGVNVTADYVRSFTMVAIDVADYDRFYNLSSLNG